MFNSVSDFYQNSTDNRIDLSRKGQNESISLVEAVRKKAVHKDTLRASEEGMSLVEYEVYRTIASEENLAALHDVLDQSKNPSQASLQHFKSPADAYKKVKTVVRERITS